MSAYLYHVFVEQLDLWIILGFFAQAMFTARFLVQWIASERARRSVVPVAFWTFSLADLCRCSIVAQSRSLSHTADFMAQYFSPKEVARAIGASESSLKRWVDKGMLSASKTAGGHRRLRLDSVLEYLRKSGRGLQNPTAISLPEGVGRKQVDSVDTSKSELLSALIAGDELAARRIILDLFISGRSVARISDEVISPLFHKVGDLWECGKVQVYEERRACEICQRLVHDLRLALGDGAATGPVAIGGTLDGDPYTLATSLAELVLRENGWRATSLGNMLPFETIRKAIVDHQPDLLWLSITSIRDEDRFATEFNLLHDVAQTTRTSIVVGGRALGNSVRERIGDATHFQTFEQMERFAKSLMPSLQIDADPIAG